jgi:ergothioneine biosynthesis protein EgtB
MGAEKTVIAGDREESWRAVRRATEALCAPLQVEDHCAQPTEEASPPKWHLAHTTWFLEEFLLSRYRKDYRTFDDTFAFLFNSYYESVGPRAEKSRRGCYSRPTVGRVLAYRHAVNDRMEELFASREYRDAQEPGDLVELGIHHEQQHQELLLTDIKAILHCNPSRPAYTEAAGCRHPGNPSAQEAAAPRWIEFPAGLHSIGWSGNGFSFDNERPRHRQFLRGFRIRDHLISNGEYLEFIQAGGYRRPDLWLSDGWRLSQREGWRAPLYWEGSGAAWSEYTLGGMAPLDPARPVCHVSYFEADAFARWRGSRLPAEAEWETACRHGDAALRQMHGALWQWTASAYLPYPGFRPLPGAVGEYNGKFMMDQMVLRGGSCATPSGHIRNTYRNFFPARTRWQFTGIRLAEDA